MAYYVKNPNYNPNDPRSKRYVRDQDAQKEAYNRAESLNTLFQPFKDVAKGFRPYNADEFYTPLVVNPNTSVNTAPRTTPLQATNNAVGTSTPNMTPLPQGQAGANMTALGGGQGQTTPAVTETAPPNVANTGAVHTVQGGDTLGTIARRYGTTVQALAQANGIADPNQIGVGQQIRIVGGGGAPAGGTPPVTAPNTGAGAVADALGTDGTQSTPAGRLSSEEIANMARQAGEAGLSTDQFLNILQQNSLATGEEVDAIRTRLGIPNLVDETFKKPEKTTQEQYKEMYEMSGLKDVRANIKRMDDEIARKQDDLVRVTSEIQGNPWISQASRGGRLRNILNTAYADISNDVALRDSYLEQYDTGLDEIEQELGLAIDDQSLERELNVEKLNYLLGEAEREQGIIEQDTITAGLRNVPDYLQGILSREATIAAREEDQGSELINLLTGAGQEATPENIVKASAGGKATTDTFRTSYEKTVNTLAQLGDLNEAFKTYKENTDKDGLFNNAQGELTGPIMGIIRSANPFDTKAQQIKAQLTALVPNLARGVYGEVGVLTDQDVALYQATLPNLKSTKEVRDALLAITAKSVYRSLENKLLIQAKGGVDVSGFAGDLTSMRALTDKLLQDAGIDTGASAEPSGGVNYTAQDEAYVQGLNL